MRKAQRSQTCCCWTSCCNRQNYITGKMQPKRELMQQLESSHENSGSFLSTPWRYPEPSLFLALTTAILAAIGLVACSLTFMCSLAFCLALALLLLAKAVHRIGNMLFPKIIETLLYVCLSSAVGFLLWGAVAYLVTVWVPLSLLVLLVHMVLCVTVVRGRFFVSSMVLGALAWVILAGFVVHLIEHDSPGPAQTQSYNISKAVQFYKVRHGNLPTQEQGLNALLTSTQGTPLLERIPRDTWGNEYQYRVPGEYNPSSFDVLSYGPDGLPGGGDDIGNWQHGRQGT